MGHLVGTHSFVPMLEHPTGAFVHMFDVLVDTITHVGKLWLAIWAQGHCKTCSCYWLHAVATYKLDQVQACLWSFNVIHLCV